MESSRMRVKMFVRGSSWGKKPATQFGGLEADVNTWLEANPNIVVEHAYQLSQPSFGWGQLAVAVWYSEADADTTVH